MPSIESTTIVRTRFAPSPSGHLHVGGARTALFCWAFARRRAGKFILRIEDTDVRRSSESASVGFLRDLLWLGITWDEGPTHESCGGGPAGPYFQSQRLDIYNKYLDRLISEGKAYYAFDTPDELEAKRAAARREKRPFRYDRAALSLSPEQVRKNLADSKPAVIRLKVAPGPVTIHDEVLGDAVIPEGEIDDFVLRKADGYPTYHFAVVIDDELMSVTHVLRAQEHFNNTAKHILIQDALGFRRPVYGHLPLIFNADGSKMSKRDKDRLLRATVKQKNLASPPPSTVSPEKFSAWLADKDQQLDFDDANRLAAAFNIKLPEINVDDFRRSGYLPDVLCNFLALNGWSPGGSVEKFDRDFLAAHFDFDRVLKTPARFDRAKLLAFNLDALQAMSVEEFTRCFRAHCREFHPAFLDRLTDDQINLLASSSHARSKTLDDPARTNRFFIIDDADLVWEDSKAVRAAMGASGRTHLESLLPILSALDDFSAPSLQRAINSYIESAAPGDLGSVAQPLRIAVTGSTVSPPIFDTLAILGRASVTTRIRRFLSNHLA